MTENAYLSEVNFLAEIDNNTTLTTNNLYNGNITTLKRYDENGTLFDDYTDQFNLAEHHIYGSDRMGIENSTNEVLSEVTMTLQSWNADKTYNASYSNLVNNTKDLHYTTQTVGDKTYEMKNHLGNVLTTISDRKLIDTDQAQICVTCDELKIALDAYIANSGDITAITALTTSLNTALEVDYLESGYQTALQRCNLVQYRTGMLGGTDKSVNFGTHPQYAFGVNDFTVEAWFNNAVSVPGLFPIISNQKFLGGNKFSGFIMDLYQNKLRIVLNEGDAAVSTGLGRVLLTIPQPSLGDWHHIVFERVGNDANNFKLYLDGVIVTPTIVTNNLTDGDITRNGVEALRISGRNSSNTESFHGGVKDMNAYGIKTYPINYKGAFFESRILKYNRAIEKNIDFNVNSNQSKLNKDSKNNK